MIFKISTVVLAMCVAGSLGASVRAKRNLLNQFTTSFNNLGFLSNPFQNSAGSVDTSSGNKAAVIEIPVYSQEFLSMMQKIATAKNMLSQDNAAIKALSTLSSGFGGMEMSPFTNGVKSIGNLFGDFGSTFGGIPDLIRTQVEAIVASAQNVVLGIMTDMVALLFSITGGSGDIGIIGDFQSHPDSGVQQQQSLDEIQKQWQLLIDLNNVISQQQHHQGLNEPSSARPTSQQTIDPIIQQVLQQLDQSTLQQAQKQEQGQATAQLISPEEAEILSKELKELWTQQQNLQILVDSILQKIPQKELEAASVPKTESNTLNHPSSV